MRRRKTGRDGFQGWSPAADAAWDRIFGGRPTGPPASKDPRFWEPGEIRAYQAPAAPAWLSGDFVKEVWD